VLLHGTTWPSKHWPEPFWIDLARRAAAAGFEIVLPAGSVEESARAHSIAAAVQGTVWDRRPLGDLIDLLGRSALAVGVDSGLTHLAAALDVPTLALYGSTDAALTGCRGRRARSLQANFPCAPCRTRDCRYGGAPHYVAGQRVEPPCYSTLPPVDVWRQAQNVAQS
jgi:heptosyltransferase-1